MLIYIIMNINNLNPDDYNTHVNLKFVFIIIIIISLIIILNTKYLMIDHVGVDYVIKISH